MQFGEYVNILKKHYKVTISDQALCTTLFDFVIEPAKLKDKNNEILTIPNSSISRMLNGIAPIHTKIRDNIYNDAVITALEDNINTHIVPELIPDDIDDLCFQIMQVIENDLISESRKAQFKIIANKNNITAFLCQTFMYAITSNEINTNENNEVIVENNPSSELVLRGISDSNNLSETGIIYPLFREDELSVKVLVERIELICNEISEIKLLPYYKNILPFNITLFEEYKYDDSKIKQITEFAEDVGITLDEDFFKLGNLQYDLFSVDQMGIPTNTPSGTADEEKKYYLLEKLYSQIQRLVHSIPFIDEFSAIKKISFAIENSGMHFDEDVRISLEIPKNNILLISDILSMDNDSVKYLCENEFIKEKLKIKRGIDFFDYDDSIVRPRLRNLIPINQFAHTQTDYRTQLENIFSYETVENRDIVQVELAIDKINQHTAIAFPVVVLLKEPVESMNYSIRSKNLTDIIYGKIIIEDTST